MAIHGGASPYVISKHESTLWFMAQQMFYGGVEPCNTGRNEATGARCFFLLGTKLVCGKFALSFLTLEIIEIFDGLIIFIFHFVIIRSGVMDFENFLRLFGFIIV